jgi:plasmid stability protein
MAKAITIRNVSDKVRNELAGRAARKGQSLQEYMLAQLARMVERPDMDLLFDQIREHKDRTGSRLSAAQILRHRDAGRRGR